MTLANVGLIVGEQVLTISALFVHQYLLASRNAPVIAQVRARHLGALTEAGARVRVVAHSLGCRQVIEAVSRLSPQLRPEEIHLCAPAVREQRKKKNLENPDQESSRPVHPGGP